jgi:hypothetical protein
MRVTPRGLTQSRMTILFRTRVFLTVKKRIILESETNSKEYQLQKARRPLSIARQTKNKKARPKARNTPEKGLSLKRTNFSLTLTLVILRS